MTETTLENYQERAFRTLAIKENKAADGAHMALGITTELGEMNVGMIKDDVINIREEHGDMAWYLANSCNIYGLNFYELYQKAQEREHKMFFLHDIVDLHKREFAYGKEMDLEQLEEQLVNAIQKLLLVAHTYEFSFTESLQINIAKLYKRYPNKFNQEDALNRDLEEEYKTLK